MSTNSINALKLLNIYDSESEDEEQCVRNESKRSSDETEISNAKKIKTEKLPLPSIFIQVDRASEHEDDPNLHDGRIRTFKHQRGNWASYIYLRYEENEYINELTNRLTEICSATASLERTSDYHISLTKTVILKYHWINPFVESVRNEINSSFLKRFVVLFDNINIYTNEERTRTFLGFGIRTGYDSLKEAVSIFDNALGEFGLPLFYKEPSFHMSILWCLGDRKEELEKNLVKIQDATNEFIEKNMDFPCYLHAKCFNCKIGNKYFVFDLRN